MIKKYVFNLLIATDQLINALTGGDPDETISSRAGKRRKTCTLCHWLCVVLDKIDPKHCANSIEADESKDGIL